MRPLPYDCTAAATADVSDRARQSLPSVSGQLRLLRPCRPTPARLAVVTSRSVPGKMPPSSTPSSFLQVQKPSLIRLPGDHI